ncbi:MAG: c-type cytochrome [Planctomycetaceae bacterium]
MLVFLKSPTVVAKTVAILIAPEVARDVEIDPLLARNSGYGGTVAEMIRNQPNLDKIWLAFVLRNAEVGWTPQLKSDFYNFLARAQQWKGGASFQGFIAGIDNEVWEKSTINERLFVEGQGARKPFQIAELPKPKGPGQAWTIEQVLAAADKGLASGRDFKNGERAFAAARCIVCHRFAGDGGATGPDLTQLAGRFNLKDLTDAIMDPSKVVSDQYKATTVVTNAGQTYTGRVVGEEDGEVTLLVDPEDASKVVTLKLTEIDSMQQSAVSLMPADLLKPLNESEVLDLLAYLLSRGDQNNAMFKK